MISVLIADDEKNIRDGLKFLIDWNSLGFVITCEAATGDEALEKIQSEKPGLVLMDIRMPGMLGIDVISKAKEAGFTGRFIIISGFSDFMYAKEAIRLGVESYITKPIDEDELEASLIKIRESVETETFKKASHANYKEKAREAILKDILHKTIIPDSAICNDIGFTGPQYRVVVYENFSPRVEKTEYNFSDLLRVTNQGNNSFEVVSDDIGDVIILKGKFCIDRFDNVLTHYEEMPPQAGSPLDGVFLAYGRIVSSPQEVYLSYNDVKTLIRRRFFCLQGQHTLGPDELPLAIAERDRLSMEKLSEYSKDLTEYIKSFNRNKVAETLYSLENYLFNIDADTEEITLALSDMYLQIKEKINVSNPNSSIPFPSNKDLITLIGSKSYLYEIIQYFSEQFEMIMNATGGSSRVSVFDDILYYIDHNYASSLKLESIAPLFGYNSAYLGKIFSKNVGENFNSYVDHVRIQRSKELLKENNLKVYEVSDAVGYSNVDYFHKKFKKYEGMSPAEYRKSQGLNDIG